MAAAFTTLQLDSLFAWYRSDRGIIQTNCAQFVALVSSDGSMGSSLLSTSDGSWLDGLNRLTIAVDVQSKDFNVTWVSRWGANAQFILRCQGGAKNPGALMFVVADGLSDPGNNYVMTTDDILKLAVPARIVVVFDTGDVKIYVNGAVFETMTNGTIPSVLTSGSEADLSVGTEKVSDAPFQYLMSRLCIWAGTALTPEQVANDFNTWIGVDPASGEPVTPTHAWRLDEASGTRHDCIGNIDLSDNGFVTTGSEAHITQVHDLSGNGFHARIRPINGPTLVDNGLGGKPTVRHSAVENQFLICGLLSGPAKPPAWSLYALAMCTATVPESGQDSQGLFNTFGVLGYDVQTWIVCVLSDLIGSNAPEGSFGMGCGDDTHYNQSNSPASTYSASTWFQLTGIFPGGVNQVQAWFNGVKQDMTFISGAGACACGGVAHPAVIGAATAEATGVGGTASNNDYFDGQWADIAVCGADTTSQREAEEAFQRNPSPPTIQTFRYTPAEAVGYQYPPDAPVGTLTLNQPAPAGGLIIEVTTSNKLLAFPTPEYLSISDGDTSPTDPFYLQVNPAGVTTPVTLTAVLDGASMPFTFTVLAGGPSNIMVRGLTLTQPTVIGGTGLYANFTLASAVGPGGGSIVVESSDPIASVPGTVPLAAGATGGLFPIQTKPLPRGVTRKSVTISAGKDGAPVHALLTVTS
jgi:hypothetical protein